MNIRDMRIFVTGATGVIGRRAVVKLVAAGHEVSGVARSAAKADELRRAGAAPVQVDLFDAEGLRRAVGGHDAVVNLATHIPPVTRAARASAWAENDRIRREASGLLIDAALAGGVHLFVQESLAFYYEDRGDEWIDDDTPLADLPLLESVRVAEANVARFDAAGGRGVVLRFGRFYAAESDYTRAQLKAGRVGVSFELGTPDGYQPLIDADDAASAVVAALGAPGGTYDVVDDAPMTRREVDGVVARIGGRRRLWRPDRFAARSSMAASFSRSNRVSNRRFAEVTGWRPRARSAAEGLPKVAGEISAAPHRPAAPALVALAILAVSGLVVGVHAQFFPVSFYEDFPFGRGWVAFDPPYNEHLVRDVGGLNLGLALVAGAAWVTRRLSLVRIAGLAWLLFAVPHAWYHLAHLSHVDGVADQIGVALGTVGPAVAAAIAAFWPARPPLPTPTAASGPAGADQRALSEATRSPR
jgi:nucleoside-diphosphate-sugar epimerase